jgi:hypothetical protein
MLKTKKITANERLYNAATSIKERKEKVFHQAEKELEKVIFGKKKN